MKKTATKKKRAPMMIDESTELQRVVDKYYASRQVDCTPKYPYVLVRRLPKAQVVGESGLVAPEVHNKPIHEGIVIATFKPFWRYMGLRPKGHHFPGMEDCEADQYVKVEAPVEPGDHILYQHFEGVPVEHVIFKQPYYKSQNYLLVNCEVSEARRGILMVLTGTKETAYNKLYKLVCNHLDDVTDSEDVVDQLVDDLAAQFVFSSIEETSRTIVGRDRKVTSRGEDR